MRPYVSLSRRELLKLGAVAAGTAALPFGARALAADGQPHFFLFLCISGGLDASYTFDARPLAMTDKNKIQNYLYKGGSNNLPDPQPILYTGSNGTSTLRTALTNDLMKHAGDFSVINGTCMATNGFVGHGNNMYYLFTSSANPGRDSFLPLIGQMGKRPLESVHIGGFEGDGNGAPPNFAGSIQLGQGQGGNLANVLKNGPAVDLASPVMKHVMARINANAAGTGLFSVGSQKMKAGMERAPALADTLKNVAMANGGQAGQMEIQPALDIALAYLKGGVTSACTIMFDRDPVMDTHDSGSCSQQPVLFKEVLKNVEHVFATLKAIPFDETAGLSMFDVTTLMVTTEFSRTMIQQGSDAANSGSDHNPLTNTVLLAGKGIVGGQVIGASDLTDVTEQGELVGVSGAHKLKDSSLTSIMGKPFDFETQKPRTDLPETFKDEDYLNFPTVVNTLMELYKVPSQSHFRINGKAAPILKGLLK